MVNEVDRGVDDLAQVVGGDVGRHTHCDALAAVHEQVREPGRQHPGLDELAGVVLREVDRVLVYPGEEVEGDRVEAALRVSGGGGGIVR